MNTRKPRLVLGFANWGDKVVPMESMLATLRFAYEHGVYEMDTALHYGAGLSAHTIGTFLHGLPREERAKIKISTKVGPVLKLETNNREDHGFKTTTGFSQDFDYTETGIHTAFTQNQFLLLTDKVPTLYLHDLDEETHQEKYAERRADFLNGGYQAFDTLKAQGKIEVAGIGCKSIDACLHLIKDGRFRINRIMLANSYSLMDTQALKEFFPLCAAKKIEVYIAAPYCGGFLSSPENLTYNYKKADAETLLKRARILEVCKRFKVELPHAAMQFVHLNRQVARVVVGARSPGEFAQSLYFASTPLDPRFWLALKAEGLIPREAPTDLPEVALVSQQMLLKAPPTGPGATPKPAPAQGLPLKSRL